MATRGSTPSASQTASPACRSRKLPLVCPRNIPSSRMHAAKLRNVVCSTGNNAGPAKHGLLAVSARQESLASPRAVTRWIRCTAQKRDCQYEGALQAFALNGLINADPDTTGCLTTLSATERHICTGWRIPSWPDIHKVYLGQCLGYWVSVSTLYLQALQEYTPVTCWMQGAADGGQQ